MQVREGVCCECQTTQELHLNTASRYTELLIVRHHAMGVSPCDYPDLCGHTLCEGSMLSPQALVKED